jgi:hypothetical protein
MTRLLPAIAIVLAGLAGCAQVGQFTAADATQAAAIATATGDTGVVACYQAFETLGTAQAAATQAGLLSLIESKRALKLALENPACQPLYGDALAELLKATPAAPFVP